MTHNKYTDPVKIAELISTIKGVASAKVTGEPFDRNQARCANLKTIAMAIDEFNRGSG